MSPLDPGRARALLERAAGVRVLVVGDLMLDRYVFGAVDRISPEAPVPVVRVQGERSALGGAGNVAANVTALGASCTVVGHVGSDAEGEVVLRALGEAGISADGVVRDAARPTTVKTRVLAKHQQIVRFDREVDDDIEGAPAAELASRVAELAVAHDVLVVQDYDKGVLTPQVVAAVLRAGSNVAIPVVVDPKRRRFFAYPEVTVLKPNARELEDALGEPIRPDDRLWLERVRMRLCARHLLVTLGDQGITLQTAEGEHVRLPTAAQAVYDVSGAGDTVSATVAVALGAGADVGEAAALANHAAALEVAKPGVQTVSAAELVARVREAATE